MIDDSMVTGMTRFLHARKSLACCWMGRQVPWRRHLPSKEWLIPAARTVQACGVMALQEVASGRNTQRRAIDKRNGLGLWTGIMSADGKTGLGTILQVLNRPPKDFKGEMFIQDNV